jgi:hypothetical protein
MRSRHGPERPLWVHSATSTDVRAHSGHPPSELSARPPALAVSLPVALLGGFEFFALPLFKLALALLGLGDLPPVVLQYATVTLLDVGALGRFADDERVRADRGDHLEGQVRLLRRPQVPALVLPTLCVHSGVRNLEIFRERGCDQLDQRARVIGATPVECINLLIESPHAPQLMKDLVHQLRIVLPELRPQYDAALLKRGGLRLPLGDIFLLADLRVARAQPGQLQRRNLRPLQEHLEEGALDRSRPGAFS